LDRRQRRREAGEREKKIIEAREEQKVKRRGESGREQEGEELIKSNCTAITHQAKRGADGGDRISSALVARHVGLLVVY